MFCKYCGAKLVDNAAFCHACGKNTVEQPVVPAPPVYSQPAPPVQPVYAQPVYQVPVQPAPQMQTTYHVPVAPVYHVPAQPIPQQPAADPAQVTKLESQALTFGILGLSLSMLGVPGIIFSVLACNKASALKKLLGQLTVKATTGYKLAKAGRIVSIIMTVLLALILPSMLGEIIAAFDNPFEYFSF